MKTGQQDVVQADLLMQDLQQLARFGALPEGGITRPAYSQTLRQAQDWLRGRMVQAGLATRVDAAGNIIGRLGPDSGPAIACGSHIDTVPQGGAYDGALGVLAGLAVARVLAPHAADLPLAFEVIAFADEEGFYYGETGARAMTGTLNIQQVLNSLGAQGPAMTQAVAAFGLNVQQFGQAARPATDFHAYLELHIEQGPVLEQGGQDIGVVEHIVGLHTSELTFTGSANHAGTTPAPLRRDALRAAAETVTACFERVETCFPPEARLTFGQMQVRPGASNVVPACVVVSREIRARSEALIESVLEETTEIAKSIAQSHDVDLSHRLLSREAPAAMADPLVGMIEAACQRAKIPYRRMSSGAGHDAQIMATHCPTGMIFVPSEGGISHNPAEHTAPAQIETGANILLATVLHLIEEARAELPQKAQPAPK